MRDISSTVVRPSDNASVGALGWLATQIEGKNRISRCPSCFVGTNKGISDERAHENALVIRPSFNVFMT